MDTPTTPSLDLTDPEALLALSEQVEKERKRAEGWAKEFAIGGPHPHKGHHAKWIFRCRRLAALREQFRLLSESYED